jgi:6-pyruvoyltetrahydropterin/6-carboxytetrahydropterin synthase
VAYEQSLEFSFEAAHELGDAVRNEAGHPYGRLHGHSYVVTVTLRAGALAPEGWIMDYAELRRISERVRERLDHRLLNAIPGLERPTLENTAAWIFKAFEKETDALWRVEIARPTLKERVAYYAKG